MKLILASRSKYRKALFDERKIPILAVPAAIDEEALKADYAKEQGNISSPKNLGIFLAQAKAQAVFKDYPEDIVIGSDQICANQNLEVFNKPGGRQNNIDRLMALQGKIHYLYTCVYIQNAEHQVFFTDTTELYMKKLNLKQVQTYVDLDKAYDCAGGYKYEAHGHELFERVHTQDPTAIQGLPMKQTLEILKKDFKFSSRPKGQ